MPTLIVIGGGIAGLSTAMLLARDGHQVTVLERDPAPPPQPQQAWESWERRGVNQFRLPHMFMSRFRELLDAELPDVAAALEAAGALRFNRMLEMPVSITGGRRRGDERFEQLTGRRPMVEATIGRAADREPGVTIRRGVLVRGLAVDAPVGRPGSCHGRRHRDGRPPACRPRDRRRWAPLDAGGVADRRRCAGAGGGAGGQRIRVLRPALPLGRRCDAPDARAAAAALRVVVAPHAARRQRLLVGRHHVERQGSGAPAGAPRRRVGARRAQLPARRPLDRRRAGHGHRRDGQDRGPCPTLRSGDRADGRRRRRRLGGVHQPIDWSRGVARLPARRLPPRCSPRRRYRRRRRARSQVATGECRARRAVRHRHADVRPSPAGADRGRDRRRRVRDTRTRRGTSVAP